VGSHLDPRRKGRVLHLDRRLHRPPVAYGRVEDGEPGDQPRLIWDVASHHLRRGQTMIASESSSPANAGMTAHPAIHVR